jgi:hypothetical protein
VDWRRIDGLIIDRKIIVAKYHEFLAEIQRIKNGSSDFKPENPSVFLVETE